MGLVLPAELKWLEWIVGSDWPEGDETAMRRCAEAWLGAGADVNDLIEDLQATASRVLGTVEGEDAEAFRAYFETYIKTDPQYLPKLAHACEQLAEALNGGASEIEYAKYMFIALLTITAIEIINLIAAAVATFGGSAAAIPAVEAAAQVTSRSIAQQLLVAIGQGALRGLLENVLLDLGVQALQVAQGNRDGIDWSKTGAAALDGAIGGAIAGGAGFGMGKMPGLDGAGDTALSGMLG
ncbi:MAG: WXG100 family type VII secretion target, partial [Actinomadura sp.]